MEDGVENAVHECGNGVHGTEVGGQEYRKLIRCLRRGIVAVERCISSSTVSKDVGGGASESVDALLYVSYLEYSALAGEGVEYLALHGVYVLKLVNEYLVEGCADLMAQGG